MNDYVHEVTRRYRTHLFEYMVEQSVVCIIVHGHIDAMLDDEDFNLGSPEMVGSDGVRS